MSADFDYDSILSESCILADGLQIDDKEDAPTSAPQPPTEEPQPPKQQPQPPAQQPPVRRPVAPPSVPSKPAPSRTVPSSQPVSALADVGNLGRLAMFGNRPQVKRRSQLRREAEAAAKASETAAKNAEPVAISRPRAPAPRGGHLSRGSTPSKVPDRSSGHPASYDGPVTRSRATVRSGGMLVPSQADFVKGIRERQRSGSSASRVPVQPVQRMASLTRAAPTVPVVAKRSASSTRTAVRPGFSGNIPLLPNGTATASRDGPRKPVLVKPSPGVAFGSALSTDKRRPYQERLRAGTVFKTTPKKATTELRAYPGPSGTTPLVLPLTVTETPHVMRRHYGVAKTPQAQNVFERLARPPLRTPAPIARTGVPNTVSHGIRVPTVQRSRDGSNTPLKRNPMAMEN